MFNDTRPTAFDLSFRLFGFPVRVSPWFWLVMVLLGEDTLRAGTQYLLMWVLCGFVSILVHELGHAVFMRWFGAWCHILLIAFGGLAVPDRAPTERWKRVVISLAGPGFGFLLMAAAFVTALGLAMARIDLPPVLDTGLAYLFWMNLFWNLFNLLPIWPLDGGKVCREACQASAVRNPDSLSFGIGFFVSAGLATVGVLNYLHSLPPVIAESLPFVPGGFMTLWFVMFAVENYMLWQQAKAAHGWNRGYDDDTPPWSRGDR